MLPKEHNVPVNNEGKKRDPDNEHNWKIMKRATEFSRTSAIVLTLQLSFID